ncbi:enoyl-CoA hydratase [Nakamurella sp. YIM 132087]|uniref:Enoyl-CoA hydratase n=1 Tax=Nakamurella alba TaxID=2665158 RepID=A0A7K1FEF4_9ACTN|nr:enoyl-CoA hydratase [Nakamurella alba]
MLIRRDGAVAILTLNRPEVLNALSAELRRALHTTIEQLDADGTVGAIVLTGAGDRAFTAGFDLKEADERGTQQDVAEENPVLAIENCSIPIIVALRGFCITGGMEIMLACDVVYADRTTRFADTHVRVGLLPGWGLSQRLARQIGIQRAKEISLSGNFVDADRAFEIGLVNRVLEPEDLMPAALALAHDFADGNREIVTTYKRLIDEGARTTLAEGLAHEAATSAAYARTLAVGDLEAGKADAAARARTRLS